MEAALLPPLLVHLYYSSSRLQIVGLTGSKRIPGPTTTAFLTEMIECGELSQSDEERP